MSHGDVEKISLDDQHVTGVDIGLNNYDMFNMTTTAESATVYLNCHWCRVQYASSTLLRMLPC